MSTNEVKQYLKNAYYLNMLIEHDKREIKRIKSVIQFVKRIGFNIFKPNLDEPVKRENKYNNKFQDLITIYDNSIKRLIEREKELEHAKEFIDQIEDERIIKLIEMKYLLGMNYYEIASESYISYRQVKRLIHNGLTELSNDN